MAAGGLLGWAIAHALGVSCSDVCLALAATEREGPLA